MSAGVSLPPLLIGVFVILHVLFVSVSAEIAAAAAESETRSLRRLSADSTCSEEVLAIGPVNGLTDYAGVGSATGISPAISGDGSTVAYIGIDGGAYSLYVYNNADDSQIFSDAIDTSGTFVSAAVDISEDGNDIAIQVYATSGFIGTSAYSRPDGDTTYSSSTVMTGLQGGGGSVAISDDGQIIAMADPSHSDDDNNEIGIVRAYKKNAGGWTQLGTNEIVGAANDRIAFNELDRPGALTMAQNGNDLYIAVIGKGSEGDSDSGNVRVYKYDLTNDLGGEWAQEGPTIYSEDKDGSSTLIADISVLSDGAPIVALGSARADDRRTNPGRVRVYKYCGVGWYQVGNTINGFNSNDGLGRTMRLSKDGTVLAVGSERVSYQLYQLKVTGSTPQWKRETKINVDTANDTNFGDSVDISADGTKILVGSNVNQMQVYDASTCLDEGTITIPADFCPSDTDNDGIPDYRDECPTEGGFIHGDGCPVDSDGDGVKDCVSTNSDPKCHSSTEITRIDNLDVCCNVERDFCPDDTPLGATVYATPEEYATSHPDLFGTDGTMLPAPSPGCPFDSDTDLIYDGADLCPGTTTIELEMAQDADNDVLLDDKGCVILPPEMWEPTYLENSAAVTTIDGNPHLDLVFTIDKDLYDINTLRGFSKLVDVQIMDAVCVDSLEGLIPVTIEDNEDVTEEASGPIPFTVSLEFDTDNLVGTELWIDEPNGVASISFCLQFSVLSFTDVNDETTAEVVTFKTVKNSILLDTEQDFSVIGSKIKRSDSLETTKTADIDYPLAACRCDENDACLDSETTVLSQDDLLKICIRFDSDAENNIALPPDYVQMTDIKSFTCTQNSVSMQPIANFARQGVEGQLTTVQTKNEKPTDGSSYTADGRMLTVTSRLLGSFFGPRELPVDCSGTIVYEFVAGSRRQRILHETSVAFASPGKNDVHRRNAEDSEAETEAESEFSIEIILARIKEERRPGIGAARFAGAAVAGVFVIGSVALAAKSLPTLGTKAWPLLVGTAAKDATTTGNEVGEDDTATDALSENTPFSVSDGSVA